MGGIVGVLIRNTMMFVSKLEPSVFHDARRMPCPRNPTSTQFMDAYTQAETP
jgi:hypothetical protein